MESNRKTAIIVGVLYIIGTAAGVLSGLILGPVMGASDILAQAAANEGRVITGALLVLVMGLPLAMVPVMLYPLFRPYGRALALGAVVFRGTLEAVAYMAIASGWLLMVTAGRAYTGGRTPPRTGRWGRC